MWNCRKCNAEVDDGFEVCWSCGTGIDGREDPDFTSDAEAADASAPAIATAEALVTIASPALPEHAHVLRCHLEAAGIGVFIADEPVSGFDWLLHRGPEPIHLQVRETDADRAKAILAEIPTEEKAPPAEEKVAETVPPPAPLVWEPANKASLDPQEYIRALESKLSSVMDEHDTPDWKVNPAFHPDVNAFIQAHANNAAFLKKAQAMQQNRAKYFATMRKQAEAAAAAAETSAPEAQAVAELPTDVPKCEEVTPEAPKPRLRFRVPRFVIRLAKWTAILLVLLVIGVYLTATTYRQMGENDLKEAIARIEEKDPDWRWDDLQAKRAQVPDEENAALKVMAAAKLLPKGDEKAYEELGTALGDIGNMQEAKPLTDVQSRRLRQVLGKFQPALLEARFLANFSTGRFPRKPSRAEPPFSLPTLPDTTVLGILSLDAVLRAQTDKNADAALVALRAILVAGRSVGDEPTLLSQLFRMNCQRITYSRLERVLALSRGSDRAFEATQQLLQDESAQPLLLRGLKGDRAWSEAYYKRADEQGPKFVQNLESALEGPTDTDKGYMLDSVKWFLEDFLGLESDSSDTETSYAYKFEHWLKMGWLLENHAVALSLWTDAVELAKLPVEERFAALDNLEAKYEIKREQARYRWGMFPFKTVIIAIRAFHRSEAEMRCTIAALAAERYRLANEKWPDSLDALVPQYLPKVPVDPYDGKVLRMRRLEDGLVIYSIGSDREDNQGTLDRKAQDQKGKDIGFRLWDVERRGQAAK